MKPREEVRYATTASLFSKSGCVLSQLTGKRHPRPETQSGGEVIDMPLQLRSAASTGSSGVKLGLCTLALASISGPL